MKITGSRLADGNKIFPPSIEIEENGLNVKIPGFLKGNSTFLSYSEISSVSVDSKLIGYSTIHFNAMGSRVSAHGFTKREVEQIKAAIDEGKLRAKTVNVVHGASTITSSNSQKESGGGFMSKLLDTSESNARLERIEQDEKEEKLRIESKVEEIASINITGSTDDISHQINKLFSIGSSKPDTKVKRAIIEKIEFGIMKLRSANANAEADFFEKKLVPLKKKGLFDYVPKNVVIILAVFLFSMLCFLLA